MGLPDPGDGPGPNPDFVRCDRCGQVNSPGAKFCDQCASPLLTAAPLPSSAPSDDALGPVDDEEAEREAARPPTTTDPWSNQDRTRDKEVTLRGLLAMMVGFAIAWIPVVGILGSLALLVGIAMVFQGRRGFGPEHHRNVTLGCTLILLSVIGVVLAFFAFSTSALALSTNPTETTAQLASALEGEIAWYAFLVVGLAFLGNVGSILLAYRLASRSSRRMLRTALCVTAVFTVGLTAYVVVGATSDLHAIAAGNTAAVSSLQSLAGSISSYELAGVLPDVLLCWAFWMVREDLRRWGRGVERPSGGVATFEGPGASRLRCSSCGSGAIDIDVVQEKGFPYQCRTCGSQGFLAVDLRLPPLETSPPRTALQ